MGQEKIIWSRIELTSTNFHLFFGTMLSMSRYLELEYTQMPLSNCKHCGFDNPCIWKFKRDELVKYYIDCNERNVGFGELGCVESTNRGARKVMYQKLNMLLGWPKNKPTPTCCVNGLSFLFPSTAF